MDFRILIYCLSLFASCHMLGSCSHQLKINKDEVAISSHQSPNVKELPDTLGISATMLFDSTSYHFGQVTEGDTIERVIYFTNLGPGDLLIELMTACECTTLDYSRLPIKKGKRSPLKIKYNAKGKDGPQIVDIDIIANTIPVNTSTKFYLNVIK